MRAVVLIECWGEEAYAIGDLLLRKPFDFLEKVLFRQEERNRATMGLFVYLDPVVAGEATTKRSWLQGRLEQMAKDIMDSSYAFDCVRVSCDELSYTEVTTERA